MDAEEQATFHPWYAREIRVSQHARLIIRGNNAQMVLTNLESIPGSRYKLALKALGELHRMKILEPMPGMSLEDEFNTMWKISTYEHNAWLPGKIGLTVFNSLKASQCSDIKENMMARISNETLERLNEFFNSLPGAQSTKKPPRQKIDLNINERTTQEYSDAEGILMEQIARASKNGWKELTKKSVELTIRNMKFYINER